MKRVSLRIFICVCISFMATGVSAGWVLDNQTSSISFVSVKKSKVAEVHTFKELQGTIDQTGKVLIKIALDSVETMIPIRNERMRKILFETAQYPFAVITANIDTRIVKALGPGEAIIHEATVTLSLHGNKAVIHVPLRVVRLAGNSLLVTTLKPFIINLNDFDMVKGVNALKEVASLTSIAVAVPATVNLIFSRDGS